MYNSNCKIVNNKIDKHILNYYDNLDNLKNDLKAVKYPPVYSDYQAGAYLVLGGNFLIYYYDQKQYLKKLKLKAYKDNLTDLAVFNLYKHLIAKRIARLVEVKNV